MTPENLKRVRKLLNLSQAALADRLGMERKSISRMESGIQPIELRTELSMRWLAWSEQQITWNEEQQELDV